MDPPKKIKVAFRRTVPRGGRYTTASLRRRM